MNDSNSANTEIKVKTAYNGEIMITYINENISYDELCNEIRGICRFPADQVIKSNQFKFVFYKLSRWVLKLILEFSVFIQCYLQCSLFIVSEFH